MDVTTAEPGAGGDRASPPTGLRFRVLRRDQLADRDLERLLETILAAFGEWPPFDPGVPAIDHLRWKTASPAGDLAAIVGEDGDRLACCQVCVSQRVRIGAETVSRVRSADFAVRPELRGRGIANELSAAKAEAVGVPTLRLTESRHPAILHMSRRSGALPLGNPIGSLVLPLDRRRMGSAAADRRGPLGGWLRSVGISVASRWQRVLGSARARPAGAIEVGRVEAFDSRFAELVEQALAAFEVAVERDPAYLSWRYLDPRGGRWTVEAAESGGTLLGYATWRVEGEVGVIGDLLVLPQRLDGLDALVSSLVRGANAMGAAEVRCWLPLRHLYRRRLRAAGFVARPAGVSHVFRPHFLGDAAAAVLAGRGTRIHFGLGDSDFI